MWKIFKTSVKITITIWLLKSIWEDIDGDEVQQPKELCDTVLKNMYDVDYIHQVIAEAIDTELDWKLDGVTVS